MPSAPFQYLHPQLRLAPPPGTIAGTSDPNSLQDDRRSSETPRQLRVPGLDEGMPIRGDTSRTGSRAHSFSTFGAFSFTLNKTFNPATGAYHGCLVLTATNGDTLKANYNLVQAPSSTNFSSASGTITFTGGTGRFKNAGGSAKVTGSFLGLYPGNSFAGGGRDPSRCWRLIRSMGSPLSKGRSETVETTEDFSKLARRIGCRKCVRGW